MGLWTVWVTPTGKPGTIRWAFPWTSAVTVSAVRWIRIVGSASSPLPSTSRCRRAGAFLGGGKGDPVGEVDEGELHTDPGDQQHQRVDQQRLEGDRALLPGRRGLAGAWGGRALRGG